MSSTRGLFFPFSIVQGETFEFDFEMTVDGVKRNFDDFNFYGQVSKKGSMAAVLTFIFEPDVENPSLVHVSCSQKETSVVKAGNYTYEIRAVDAIIGKNRALLLGSFDVEESALRHASLYGDTVVMNEKMSTPYTGLAGRLAR